MLLGKKAMTKEDSILKIRDITLPTKVHIVKAVVFPIAMHRYESWTINKADHWRMDAFKLWCRENSWELLGQMEIKPVNPKENWPWIFIGRTDAEAPYFGLQMGRANSLEKTLMLGKTEGRRRRGWQRLYGIIDSMDIKLSNHWETVKGRGTWCAVVQLQSWTWLSDWTTIKTEVERANESFFCFLSSLKLRFLQLATESDLMSTLRNSNLSILWYLCQVWNFFV